MNNDAKGAAAGIIDARAAIITKAPLKKMTASLVKRYYSDLSAITPTYLSSRNRFR